jgi:predicted esterase
MNRLLRKSLLAILTALLLVAVAGSRAWAVEIVLKDGRVLKGKLGLLAGLGEVPQAPSPDGSGPLQLIVMIDDELRRTFVSKRQVQEVRQDDPAEIVEKFPIHQRVIHNGPTVKSVGPFQTDPFDQYGRRTLHMVTSAGPVDIIQAITEITPRWTKVEGMKHVWDMRMATSSIPPDALAKILARQIEPDNLEHRKKLARFYLQAERYEEAAEELEKTLADFPNLPEVREQIEPSLRALKQLGAQRLLEELKLRRDAGQHRLVFEKLDTFPTEGVAGEILQAVSEMQQEYETFLSQRTEAIEHFDALLAKIQDSAIRERILRVRREIGEELSINTFRRMAAFRQMVGDESLTPEEKLALAVSGWLLGSDEATLKLPVALSAFEVRDLVRQYMNAGDRLSQARILEQMSHEEGAAPSVVARLIALMKPPVDPPPAADGKPGFFELEVPGLGNSLPVRYLVQLPPEYDPLRSYPTVLTLHGGGTTPEQQLDWWAGPWQEGGFRLGQASRYGHIVIAPAWAVEHQRQYEYSSRELAAVLDCLRDACRRFAIDTDRVYLSGFSMGGDAAWDIALAHPDLWAGVIPIAATSDRYCSLYWENAKLLPLYFVGGEMDGNKMARNAMDLDRYLKRGFNATVVEYQGRGHEHFSDEIQRIFEWMGRMKRDFFPREFQASTMRPWDNFFWWVELDQLPPRSIVYPLDWPPGRGVLPAETTASITPTNGLYVRTGAARVTIWLSPEMLNFDRRATITVNGDRVSLGTPFIEPDLETLLEDVRTRADRQHPFWCKVESATGRVSR